MTVSEFTRTPRRKGAGRASRVQQRQTEGAIAHPCPPGQRRGGYQVLSDSELKAIIDTAYRLLAELGMGDVPDDLVARALEKGAYLNADGRLCYSRELMENIIDQSPSQFMLYGRDPAHDIEVGGDKIYYGTGGAAVQAFDTETQKYRPSTIDDLYGFTCLADKLENIAWYARMCVATDIADVDEMDNNTIYALIAGTQKPVGSSFTFGSSVTSAVRMFDMAMGGEGSFAKRPCCKTHISPIISPMRYGADAYEVALESVKHNMVINSIIAAQAGATAPATLAGMLAQSTAETLAALAMVYMIKPGHPMVFSNWPFVVDLRTGSFAGSGGEISLMNAASGQIAKSLGLVGGVSSSMSDAKAIDAQMGMEKATSSLMAGLSGANLVYESAGMTASLLGASLEAMILDNEVIAINQRILRGIEVSEDTLGFETICNSVHGSGHFLGGDHTMQAMLRDYYYPRLADRETPQVWQERGALDMQEVIKKRLATLQGMPHEPYISRKNDDNIRSHFRIHLQT